MSRAASQRTLHAVARHLVAEQWFAAVDSRLPYVNYGTVFGKKLET